MAGEFSRDPVRLCAGSSGKAEMITNDVISSTYVPPVFVSNSFDNDESPNSQCLTSINLERHVRIGTSIMIKLASTASGSGLRTKQTVIPGESQEEYDQFRAESCVTSTRDP
jgi:hypothetical protein